jgi:hypothetical protein
MKKIVFSLMVLCGLFVSLNSASANSYTLNNSSVDNLFSSAVEVNMATAVAEGVNSNLASVTSLDATQDALIAAVLDFFLGEFGVHRYYLGTKSTMFFWYFCTFGGIFGIVPFVDFVLLLVNMKDISKYKNNENFIMW